MKKLYFYVSKNLLENPLNYHMSKYVGPEFLESYKESRLKNIEIFQKEDLFENYESVLTNILENKPNLSNFEFNDENYETENLLSFLYVRLKTRKNNEIAKKILNQLIKKFEIKKLLCLQYDSNLKEIGSDCSKLSNYILLSLCCLLKYEQTNNLKFLNASLKLNDTISSQHIGINTDFEKSLFCFVLQKELYYIDTLCKLKGIKK
jgi:hypothetical protein